MGGALSPGQRSLHAAAASPGGCLRRLRGVRATDAGSAHRRGAPGRARHPAGGGGDPRGAPIPLAGPGRRLQLDRLHRRARPGRFPPGSGLRAGRAALDPRRSRHPASRSAVAAQQAELRGAPGNALQSPRPSAVADVDLHATSARRVDPIPVPLLGTRERPGSPGQREVDPLSPDGGVVASCLVSAGPLPPASSRRAAGGTSATPTA